MSPWAAAYFLIQLLSSRIFSGWRLIAHVDGFAVAVVAVVADGHDAGEHDADFVGVGEFVHRLRDCLRSGRAVMGPVLPAMSLVPARITTTFGWSAMTSGRKRMSICGVVWPLMPRSM